MGGFPVVTRRDAGRQELRGWAGKFCASYAARASVIRIPGQAGLAGGQVYGDGMRLLFRRAGAITQGITAAGRRAQPGGGLAGHRACSPAAAHQRSPWKTRASR